MNYYKRINRNENIFENAPIALQKSYEALKENDKVIVANDAEGEFLLVPTEMVDEFISVAISRADVKAVGYDADKISDSDMQYIADNISDALIEYGGYWENLECEVERNGGEKCHRMIDTSFGEICLKPSKEEDGFLDMFQGDNWDEFVGAIQCDIDASDEEILGQIEEALYY